MVEERTSGMTSEVATVFVVDDEEQARESVCALVQSMNFRAQTFSSGEAFLEAYDGTPGCVVTDYRMTGMNGLELQDQLLDRRFDLPVIIVTAYARTPVTVRAIQNGAVAMLDKPYNEDDLWSAIREGLSIDEKQREEKQCRADVAARVASLNEKERQVLELLMAGEPNKAMANKLDVSLRTVENRRRTVFSKLGAQTVAELVTLVLNHQSAGYNSSGNMKS